ncbi:acyltransferase family protein [Cupriavidus sp. D39]|uniref:acyltransferase family protein n=1 Tax=Cupriavidus sp. D39 TaxID=2997877 RepID=UPI00226DF970|nr:acyltransferase family protein [Cupriavidus sp. D39]MCY0856203.1 acyltransferase family protein [Cupriavidus sp. D39]
MLNGFVTDTPSANGPLWSLSIEVWYYFLAAILAVPRGWWKVLSLPFAGAVIWLGMNNEAFLYYLPVWWAGYLLAVLHNRLFSFSINLLRAAAACFSVALLLGVRFVSASYAHDPVADSLSLIASFNIAMGLGFCFILALVLQGRVSIPIFARSAARYSYTLYIVHAPILFLFGFLQPYIQDSLGASVIVSLLIIVGVAAFSAIVSRAVENRRLIISLFALGRKPQPLR